MSCQNWSFRFHNKILKHSNDTMFLLQEFNPTPGNIGHRAHCDARGIKRSELKWQKLFDAMCVRDEKNFRNGFKFRRFWWNIHPEERYWRYGKK